LLPRGNELPRWRVITFDRWRVDAAPVNRDHATRASSSMQGTGTRREVLVAMLTTVKNAGAAPNAISALEVAIRALE
jgi:hypothetical protein